MTQVPVPRSTGVHAPGSSLATPSLTTPSLATLGRLGRELHAVCVGATQPEEIAAALEAHGLNDDLARQQYGMPDVFACAEALYSHLPYRAPLPVLRPLARPAWAMAPRGVLYALPGAALALATPLLPSSGEQTALFLAVVFGWGWGQGLASVGYRKTGAPLLRFLRGATALTLPVAALVGTLGAAFTHQPLLAGALVCALAGTSFAAFASLLILGRAALAALAYLPSLAALLVLPHLAQDELWLDGFWTGGRWAAVGCAALLPLLALAGERPPRSGLQLPSPAWHATLAHAASGWTCALFVTSAFGAATSAVLGPGAILPVIVSVGAMEVLSLRFYGRLHPLARHHGDLPHLARSAARVLGGAVLLYLLALAALLGLYLSGLNLLVTPRLPDLSAGSRLLGLGADPAATAQLLVAVLLYGVSLLLGTVVGNLGRPWITSLAWFLGSLIYLIAPFVHTAVDLPGLPLLSSLVVVTVMGLGVLKVLLMPATYR